MSLTIKNPETIGLARQYALKTGLNQTAAITSALRQAMDATVDGQATRRARIDDVLREVWSHTTPQDRERARQTMSDLYDENGLPR